jgi:hypothetical protein
VLRCVIVLAQVRSEGRGSGASMWREAWRELNVRCVGRVVGGGLKMAESNMGMHPTRWSVPLINDVRAGG